MGAFDGLKSTLKQNSFFGVLDGWKDGVENVVLDQTQRGTLGQQNNVQAGTTEGSITRNADGSMSIYRNGSWQPYGDTSANGTQDPTTTAIGGGGGGSVDWGSLAQAQSGYDSASSLLSRLPGLQATWKSNLDNAYGQYRNTLDTNFNRDQGAYQDQRRGTITDQQNKKFDVYGQVRNRGNSLQRLMGAGGDSQAGLQLAPYAAARTGTKLINQVNDTYAQNLSSLDNNWNQYDTDYKRSVAELEAKKKNEEDAQAAKWIEMQQGAIQQQKQYEAMQYFAQTGDAAGARAIYAAAQPQINSLQAQADAYGKQTFANPIKDLSYNAPELKQYQTENVGNVGGIADNIQQNVNPYFQMLLKRSKEDQNFGY